MTQLWHCQVKEKWSMVKTFIYKWLKHYNIIYWLEESAYATTNKYTSSRCTYKMMERMAEQQYRWYQPHKSWPDLNLPALGCFLTKDALWEPNWVWIDSKWVTMWRFTTKGSLCLFLTNIIFFALSKRQWNKVSNVNKIEALLLKVWDKDTTTTAEMHHILYHGAKTMERASKPHHKYCK